MNKTLLFLTLASLAMALPTRALADSIPAAVLGIDTLTFTYADEAAVDDSTTFQLNYDSATPGWLVKARDVSVVVFNPKFAKARPASTNRWFNNFTKLKKIDGIENLNTSNVTDMGWMFAGCQSLTSLDVSGFNTANVTDMSNMFAQCRGLRSLDVSHFNTANVTNMEAMFNDCSSVMKLDVSGFNTARVTDMSYMFFLCASMTILDVSHFNTSNVTDMSWMFAWCGSIYEIDVSHFNTANVTDMGGMFIGCKYLHDVDAAKLNTARVTSMVSMFSGCATLSSLDLSSFDMSNVTDARCMLQNCSNLSKLNMGDNCLNSIGQTGDAFKGVGKSSKPCALTVGGGFDKSVLGTKTGSGSNAYYSWLGGYFAEPTVKTGISSPAATVHDNAPAYTLGGQRAGGNHKGLTVRRGRKFIRR